MNIYHCQKRSQYSSLGLLKRSQDSSLGLLNLPGSLAKGVKARGGGVGGGGGGVRASKNRKKLLFPKSIHFLTTEILLPLIYL